MDMLITGQGCAADTLGTKVLVCRERELNGDKDVPQKGRRLLATDSIPAGTLLFAAKPYAVVPSLDPCRGDYFVCSSYKSSKRIEKATADVIVCTCIEDVVWCNADCKAEDQDRHKPECDWLQLFADYILAKHITYDFDMLWVNARVLCQRHAKLATATGSGNAAPTPNPSMDELRAPHAYSWDSVLALRANEELFPTETLSHRSLLAARYLEHQPFAGALSAADLVRLICKEETNAFCMYPKATGIFPYPGPQENRGSPYGLALHTRASFFNHSCLRNVMHGPDHVSRMVMHATRDIALGETCCIAYFDLAETSSLAARRELLTKFFNFTCDCRRCLRETGLQQVD